MNKLASTSGNGYKETKLGRIPATWNVSELIDFCVAGNRAIVDGPFGSNLKTIHFRNKGVPVINSSFVTDFKFETDKYQYVDQELFKREIRSMVVPGDIVMAKIGARCGSSAIFPMDHPVSILSGNSLKISVDQNRNSTDFVWYLLVQEYRKNRFKDCKSVGAQPAISIPQLKKLKFIRPPLPEQKKIVLILATWDRAIEKMEQLIAQKQELKKGLLHLLLTGKVRFKEFVKSKKMKKTKIGMIPEEWNVCSFVDLSDRKVKWSITGGPFGSNLKAEDYTAQGVRIIQLQNIGDGLFLDGYKIFTSEEKADELISCNIFPGDIILSKMGDPVARACFIPSYSPRYLMASDGIRLVVDKSKFDERFVLSFINGNSFRTEAFKNSTGSTRQRIGLDDLKGLLFLRPPLREQKKIAVTILGLEKEIEKLEISLGNRILQKRGLMQKLLSGQVRAKGYSK